MSVLPFQTSRHVPPDDALKMVIIERHEKQFYNSKSHCCTKYKLKKNKFLSFSEKVADIAGDKQQINAAIRAGANPAL